jgi:hypothetical protein
VSQATKIAHYIPCPIWFRASAFSLHRPAVNVLLRLPINMSRVLISVLLLFAAISSMRGAEEPLNPPFGFRWNDTMSRVEAVLKGAKASILKREKVENREIWTVEGLVHPGLKRTKFTFKGGGLYGVELE